MARSTQPERLNRRSFVRRIGGALAGAAVTAAAPGLAQQRTEAASVELQELRTVYDDGKHNAFTDLQRWRDAWWITFRSGTGHVGIDGDVLILRSEDLENWEEVVRLDTGLDDRDPKLLPLEDGLRSYFFTWDADYQVCHSYVAESSDGLEWSEPRPIYEDMVRVWRPRRFGEVYWCAAHVLYPTRAARETHRVDLLRSDDGFEWEKACTVGDLHTPNESDLWIDEDGVMRVFIRRETGPKTALLAIAEPPYTEWDVTDLGVVVQGPIALPTDAGIWVAGRSYDDDGSKTMLWSLEGKELRHLLTLPSGGDTSYPGMVRDGDTLWMSYYSEHESQDDEGYRQGGGPARIYLAELAVSA